MAPLPQGKHLDRSRGELVDGDSVDLWIAKKKKKRRKGTFRVISDNGREALVENMGAIFNHPKN